MPKRPRESENARSGQGPQKVPRHGRSPPPLSAARRVPTAAKGKLVAAADEDGRVRIYSFEFETGTKAVVDLAFLGGGVVAGVFGNGKVQTWLSATGEEREAIRLDEGCTAVAKVDENTFVVGNDGGGLVFVSHSGGRDLHILCRESTSLDAVSCICVHGEVIVASRRFAVVGVWKAMKYSKVAVLVQNDGFEKHVAVGERFVICSSSRCSCIYDKAENFTFVCKVLHSSAESELKRVIFVGDDLLLMVSKVSGGELLFTFEKPSTFLLAPIDDPATLSGTSGFRTSVTPLERHSLVLSGNGYIACVEAGATPATGVMPPGPVTAAMEAHTEVLHAPKLVVSVLAGQTHVKQKTVGRASVEVEPVSQGGVPTAKLGDGNQAPVKQQSVGLNAVKQEPGNARTAKPESEEVCCFDLEADHGSDMVNLKAASSQPALLEVMPVDAICDVLAGVMISFEESFRAHVPLLSGCLRRLLRQNLIAADSIVNFPETKLFAIIQGSLAKDEAYGKLSQNVADNFEWRLQRFLHQLRL